MKKSDAYLGNTIASCEAVADAEELKSINPEAYEKNEWIEGHISRTAVGKIGMKTVRMSRV